MKHKFGFIVIFVLFSCLISSAQQVDNSSMKTTYRFCEIIISGGFVHNGYVAVDYGQPLKVLGKRRLTDKDGVDLKFNSVVAALNYMSKMGWEYFQVYTIQGTPTSSEAHYVLRKEVLPGEDTSKLY